ncbi:MAG: RluA family pseudouridine synthase [Lachnospiraceae bacterium]|nr:RluA family pseudouridine synthase [Lachnospiraceae bacterium]
MRTQIIYEDEQLLVVYKPAGLATESGRPDQMDLVSELKGYLSRGVRLPYLGLAHRLDQPVEGLLAVARDSKTASELGTQLRNGQMKKTYRAVLYLPDGTGPVTGTEETLTDFMIKEGNRARIVESTAPGAKKALLTYTIRKRSGDTALAEIELGTGRFHQIRCQMAAHGMPLLGDQKYGTEESKKESLARGIKTVALCANCLVFIHPGTGREMKVTTKPQNIAFQEYDE